jgi:hypothetical protein
VEKNNEIIDLALLQETQTIQIPGMNNNLPNQYSWRGGHKVGRAVCKSTQTPKFCWRNIAVICSHTQLSLEPARLNDGNKAER